MLGSRIRELRKEKKMSQRELAEKLNVSQQTIGAWEIERIVPGADTLNILANYFNVSTDYLLGRSEKKKENNNDYTLKEALDSVMSYDGKPMTENDREVIEGIIKGYMENKK
ncbi:helix-turn-helix domain-containing protein [Ligilactobacillus cholophilus]|uniref:helix-turn-helix domain-containing protein n=1 Tax=Ligilactobacillus cholophilus TaxID=3050131 RepID=UPI0025AF0BFB|nr:helix-turn-helix transcriptional regulator [Ligilactobacillus cholophilus]